MWSFFFFQFFFSMPCVHLFLSKDEPLFIIHKSPTCVPSEYEENVLRYVCSPHVIKLGGKKTCGFRHQFSPGQEINIWQDDCPFEESQQKQMQISSRLDLLKFTLPAQPTSHRIFPTAQKGSIWRKLSSNVYQSICALECLDLCKGWGKVFISCHAENHFEVLLWFAM